MPLGAVPGLADGRHIRLPAVAGRFYPAGISELTAMVDTLLDAAPTAGAAAPIGAATPTAAAAPAGGERVGEELPADAYVVPHAGYRYSGLTAAQVYARLRRRAGQIRRIVLIGPAHYVSLRGCAAPSTTGWLTPLGEVPVDRPAVTALARAGHLTVDDEPHAAEHSLEVQLPFLQRSLPAGVPIVPITVGQCPVDQVAAMLAATSGPGTVVLCSTDLSHYLDQATARRRDEQTVRAVLDLAGERIGARDACGAHAVRGLIGWARRSRLRPRLLHLCTSADTTGDPSRVVGYAALALAPGGLAAPAPEGSVASPPG